MNILSLIILLSALNTIMASMISFFYYIVFRQLRSQHTLSLLFFFIAVLVVNGQRTHWFVSHYFQMLPIPANTDFRQSLFVVSLVFCSLFFHLYATWNFRSIKPKKVKEIITDHSPTNELQKTTLKEG